MSKTILAEVDGFTPVIDTVVADTDLVSAVVFGRIWRFCQMKDGICNASLETIAEDIGMDRASVMRHAKKLVDAGYLKDLTPELRNHPHTYADTGKASLHVGVSGVAHSNTGGIENISVAESNVGVAQDNASVAESKLKIVLKKDSNKQDITREPFSKEKIKEITENTEAHILAGMRGAESSWPGREKMPEPNRDLLDMFVKVSGIKPTAGQFMDWMKASNDWLEIGAHPQDIDKAYDESQPNEKGLGGFACYRPGSLTGAVQKVVGERQKSHKERPGVEQALAEIARMQR
jgi:DNA-binding Lrp family transcriptional regulator